MSKFELVVPAYNEGKNLPMLVKRAAEAAHKENMSAEDFQFVIVNNGSKDNSKEVLAQLSEGEYKTWFRVVDVEVNQGYGFGLWQGLKSTTSFLIQQNHKIFRARSQQPDDSRLLPLFNKHHNVWS